MKREWLRMPMSVRFFVAIIAVTPIACLRNIGDPSAGFAAVLTAGQLAGGGTYTPITRLPLKTYQTGCWDDSGTVIPCAGTGQDGEYQYGRAVNFTAPTLVGASDYITTDGTTGMVWVTCSEGLSGAVCSVGGASSLTWSNADTDCTGLNSGAGYANRTDWRLPTVDELETLINYSVANPAAFAPNFPATDTGFYWASNSYVPGPANAWRVRFADGVANYTLKTVPHLVRCVSAGLLSTTLADNGDGTVSDQGTGLVWQKCSMGENNDSTCSGTSTSAIWTSALTYCNSLVLAGRNWRLPNVNELKSILDRTTSSPAANSTYFPGIALSYYWTSSTYIPSKNSSWTSRFNDGSVSYDLKTNANYVRCVSTGP